MQIENPYIQYMYSYPHKTAYRALKDVDLKSYISYLVNGENSLYFHIPFCQYKCGYCNLFSLAGQPAELMEKYVNAMERQAIQIHQILPEGAVFSDLTLGGGTPLILPEHLLERIFYMAREYFGFRQENHRAVIVETSPNQTTESKLKLLKEQGVTRLSIGVQSFQEEELRTLSRFHRAKTAKKALEMIKRIGFSCVNVDLIYGIPGQTKESLLNSLEQALFYEPKELFIYPLYIKPETGLYQQNQQSCASVELYGAIREKLEAQGYEPHSMRRFVKKNDSEKDRKTSLCGFGNTLSVGCGARSYLGNLHFCTPYAIKQSHCMALVKEYLEREDHLQVTYGYLLNEEEQKRRYVIKHILFETGIVKEDYRKRFGAKPQKEFAEIAQWIEQGYAVETKDAIVLTKEGFALSDYLGPQLMSTEVQKKMMEWKEKREKWGRKDSGIIEEV